MNLDAKIILIVLLTSGNCWFWLLWYW